jgi:anti-sigma B factor antagonist
MQDIWTEELDPVVVRADALGALAANISVGGVGAQAAQATVRLHGELCAQTTPPLRAAVDRVLALGVTDLRFELDDLRLCTSAGIDLWVELAARIWPLGGDLRLAGATGVVRRALDAVGVDDSGFVRGTG